MTDPHATPVCQHGWPIFDVDPCPDCLRAIDAAAEVTAPVNDSELIPEFLQRKPVDPNAPKVGPMTEGHPTRSGGSDQPCQQDTPPTSLSGKHGYPLTEHDLTVIKELTSEQGRTKVEKAKGRIATMKARAAARSEYAPGKRWDMRNGKWV
jgi:hypothetical protein